MRHRINEKNQVCRGTVQMRNVLTVPSIFSSHAIQSSMLLAQSSHATRWRHGRNNVCTRLCLHLRHVISDRSRSFSLLISDLSTEHSPPTPVQLQ